MQHTHLALTIMTLTITFFEIATIWMNFSSSMNFLPQEISRLNLFLYIIPTAIFIILTAICSNLLNIYLASACYESFIPKFEGTKGHAIMGLLGTATYTFVQISRPIDFIQGLVNCYIAVLGFVLLISALARVVVKHRPKQLEKIVNIFAWAIGSLTSTILLVKNPDRSIEALLYGSGASIFFFMLVFFLEENIWAIQKIRSKAQSDES
jgi:hypothetical protein